MRCFDGNKYELIGYSRPTNSYVIINKNYRDEVVLVQSAVITNNNGRGKITLPRIDSDSEEAIPLKTLQIVNL